MTTYSEEWYTGQLSVTTYVYQRNTWEEVYDMVQDYTALATDMAYDAIDDVAYGCFKSDDGVAWGYMDPHTLSVTHIASLEGELVAVAVNAKGEAYAITNGGYLVRVDKKTGQLTAIGPTGIVPAYLQTATFGSDGVLYWAASLNDDSSGLYTVNLTTGAASLVTQFPNDEEVVALYACPESPADGAPGALSPISLHFAADQLSGTVGFTIPTTTADGSPLSGSVSYVVTVDGEDLATGSATAGQNVSAAVTVPSAGYHYFVVTLSNAAGAGTPATLRQWIGIDQPNPVTNVVLTKTGERAASISWTAPSAGSHGGYFSADRITYTVTRQPDGKQVATGLTATSFTDDVDIAGQALLRYSVVAVADNVESAATVSNGIVFGDAYEVPVHFSFDTEDEFDTFTIIDNNETPSLDSGCWLYSPSGKCAGYNTGTKDGDDWLITPAIKLKADRRYTFQYDVLCYSDYWPDEYSVYMGSSATVEGMTTQLLPKTTIYWDEMRTMTFTITVPEDGIYYFGFFATSEAGGAFFLVDDIKVEEEFILKAPAEATELTVTAGADGALEATVSFVAPEKSVDGSMLSSLTNVQVLRNQQLVKTFDAPSPGEPLSFTDEDALAGMVSYEVIASNAQGTGPAAKAEAWVGIDYPSAPLNVKVALNDEGHPVITWQQPEGRGVYGGYVDNASVTYTVYKTSGMQRIAQNLTALSYTDTSVTTADTGSQSLHEYAVYAASPQGMGYPATAFYISGASYELPFAESFAGAQPAHFWGFSGTNGESWEVGDDWSYYSQDEDDGLLAYRPAVAGSEVTAFSGKIAVKGTANPVLTFYLNKLSYSNNGFYETNPDDDELYVQVAADGFDLQTIHTVRMADIQESGYLQYEVPLGNFSDNDFIIIAFKENAQSDQTPLMLDNIRIEDRHAADLALGDVEAPASATVGEEIQIKATVKNIGATDAEDYALELYRGQQLEQTLSALSTAKNAETALTFTLNVPPSWTDSETFTVRIAYEDDENTDDNSSEPFTIAITHLDVPSPTNLEFTDNEGTVTFTWSEPEVQEVGSNVVTEDFESYSHGDLTLEDWILKDKAPFGDYGVIEIDGIDIPHYLDEQAFMVFSPEAAGIDLSSHPEWQPHSGSKLLASFGDYANDFGYKNNDWLISPLLSSDGQRIAFYARTASANQQTDYIEVLYSTTDADPSSFQLLTGGNSIQLPNEWTRYEFTLPVGAVRFAIHNVSEEGYAVLIDDITYTPDGTGSVLTLLGYRLYCDDVLVNSELYDAPTCTLTQPANGTYTVTAVYNVGESEASNAVILSLATGICHQSTNTQHAAPYYDLNGRLVTTPVSGRLYLHQGKKIIYRSR